MAKKKTASPKARPKYPIEKLVDAVRKQAINSTQPITDVIADVLLKDGTLTYPLLNLFYLKECQSCGQRALQDTHWFFKDHCNQCAAAKKMQCEHELD